MIYYIVKNVDTRQKVVFQTGELEKTITRGEAVLWKIKSTFPFDPLPDELIVDRHKISLIKRPFFFSERVTSLSYDDISNVVIEHSMVFASLEISHKIFGMQPLTMHYLRKKEADKVKQLILGLIIAKKEGNKEIFSLSRQELIKKASELGRARIVGQ